ncbi:MAG: DUF3299 domain-containing protein [Opitutus sp.]|nr:DUF3299 domain-containing protein [Opitutus sp.]
MKTFRHLILAALMAMAGGGGWLHAAEAAADAGKVAAPATENGYLKLGFDLLASYVFVPPAFDPAADANAKPPTGEEQIPATVKGWHGKKAVLIGFMVPVKMEKGLVTEFLLMRNTMACCFGSVPNMNEWVIVKMKKGVAPMMDVPVAFYGQLKVGAMFENGYMTGLYELECERMGEVQG